MSEVRLAHDHEYEAIGELTVRAYRSGGVLIDDDGYAATLADVAGRAALAEVYVLLDDDSASNGPVGTVTLSPHGTAYAQVSRPGDLEFRMLAVAPEAGGHGYGSRLVAFCAEQGRARGHRALAICVIDTNTSALRLYDHLGFVRQPDRDVEPAPGIRLLVLTLDL